jgi:hypothetical protein
MKERASENADNYRDLYKRPQSNFEDNDEFPFDDVPPEERETFVERPPRIKKTILPNTTTKKNRRLEDIVFEPEIARDYSKYPRTAEGDANYCRKSIDDIQNKIDQLQNEIIGYEGAFGKAEIIRRMELSLETLVRRQRQYYNALLMVEEENQLEPTTPPPHGYRTFINEKLEDEMVLPTLVQDKVIPRFGTEPKGGRHKTRKSKRKVSTKRPKRRRR